MRTHKAKSRRLKGQAGANTLLREGQAWRPAPALGPPLRAPLSCRSPPPPCEVCPHASAHHMGQPRGFTTPRLDNHGRRASRTDTRGRVGWRSRGAELRTEAGGPPESSPSLLTGPLSVACVWAATLLLGAKILLQGRLLRKPEGSPWNVTGSFITKSWAELILGETINCPDPDESEDERRGAVSSQAGRGGL